MIKSVESKNLEEYAASLDKSYDDFVFAMGYVPQKRGIDKELWDFVEKNKPNYDELMFEYSKLLGLYHD